MHLCTHRCTKSSMLNHVFIQTLFSTLESLAEQGGKNRRRGKNENDDEKRELVFKEEGQGEQRVDVFMTVQEC